MNIMTLCLEAGALSKLTETQPMEPSLLPDLGLISGLIGLGFAILFALMMFWVKRRKTNMSLTWMFVIVWVFGFVVYDVGMYTGNKMSLIGNAPMAMLEAFGMFLINSDVSAIHDPQHKSWVYMCCFSLAHFMAAFISMMFVIKHFGFNILAGIRMFVESVFRRKRDNTYLFWGMNSQSYCLAKDIENIAPKGDYRIIVVRASNDSETTSERNGMDRLLNFLSLRNKDLDRLIELDCLTTNSFSDLSQISVEENTDTYPDILKNNLRLRALKRIIKRKTAKQLHVFLITENYQYNIQATTNLKADRTINEFVQNKGGKVTFYCHARYNSVHRVIEDEHISENIEVRVIDSAHIAVESLKREVEFQPVSFVDINSDATVSTPFKSLVVGFGEVGFDSVR
ncbi:MAG: hypothetical protein IK092_01100, partial [Muribaculaceae bacterium]|nr:hypothetical protein [Muribaculaceae bacterium]